MNGVWSEFAEEGLQDSELQYNSGMSNKIKIHRPIEFRGSFDANENTPRKVVFECDLPTIKKERFAEEAAELSPVTFIKLEAINEDNSITHARSKLQKTQFVALWL